MIQFLSPYGTLWSARGVRERRLPARGRLRRRAELRLLQRRALGGVALRRPPLQRGLERRRVAALHRARASTMRRPGGPMTTSTPAATSRTDDQPDGRDSPRTTRMPGSAICTRPPTSRSARRSTPRCSASPSPTAGSTTTTGLRSPTARSTRSTRSTPAWRRAADRRLSRSTALQAAVGLRPGPDHLQRPALLSTSGCATTGSSRRRRTGRAPDAPQHARRRGALDQRRAALCHGQRRRRPTSAIRNPSTRRRSAPTPPATRSSRPAARQYEAGVKYQPPGTSSLFTAAVFEITKSNTLVTDPTNPNFSDPGRRGEVARARARRPGRLARLFGRRRLYLSRHRERGRASAFAGVPREPGLGLAAVRRRGPARRARSAGFGVRYVGSTLGGGGRRRRASRSTTRCSATSGTATWCS